MTVALWALLLATANPADSGFSAQVEVRIQVMDVFVWDEHGKFLPGLKAEDFVVSEGGKVLPLELFEENRLVGERKLTAQPRRFLIVMDGAHGGDTRVERRTLGELADFVSAQAALGDQFALASIGTTGIGYIDFEPAPTAVLAALGRTSAGPQRHQTDVADRHTTTPETVDIDNGMLLADAADRARARAAGDNLPGANPAPRDARDQADRAGSLFWSQLATAEAHDAGRRVSGRVELGRFLGFLETLGKAMKAVPGPKITILVSGGFEIDQIVHDRTTRERFDRTRQALIDGRCVVTTFDLNGLQNPDEADNPGPRGGQPLNPALRSSNQAAAQIQDALIYFATALNGRPYNNLQSFTRPLQEVSERAAGYYSLGFLAPASERNGSFHVVDVKLKGRTASISALPGYSAPRPFAELDAVARRLDLLAALALPAARDELPITARAYAFEARGQRIAYLSFAVPVSALAVDKEAKVEYLAQSSTAAGVASDSLGEHFGFKPQAVAAGATLIVEDTLKLEPGGRARLAVRDNTSGAVGVVDLEVAGVDAGALRLSSLVPIAAEDAQALIVNRRDRAGTYHQDGTPLQLGSHRLNPSLADHVQRGADMVLYYEVYGLTLPAEGEPPLDIAYVARQGETSLNLAAKKQVYEPHRDEGRLTIVTVLPTDTLAPGAWALEATVKDKARTLAATARLALTLDSK